MNEPADRPSDRDLADGRTPLDRAALEVALRGAGARRVEVVAQTASTSTDLVDGVRADADAWPDRSVLVADHQAAGRGRAGRTWTTPPGSAVTISVLLRPPLDLERFGWVPLLSGLAAVRAIGETTGLDAVLKWPNDVLVPARDGSDVPGWGPYRKVAGVLGDLVTTPEGAAVVVGIGINVSQRADELPVPHASSLRLAARTGVDRAALLTTLVRHLVALDDRWRGSDGDAATAGLADRCAEVCVTLGAPVAIDLPDGSVLEGRATGLARDGALEVRSADGRLRSVRAGDVRHVRSRSVVRHPGPRAEG